MGEKMITANIYFEPCNLRQWNIFEEISNIGHIEPFLAVKSMQIGDYVLHYVGKQDKRYKPGVYAISKIIKSPYICRNRPNDYCNNKLSIDVKVLAITYNEPYLSEIDMKRINKQFRSVHKLNITDNNTLEIIMSSINNS